MTAFQYQQAKEAAAARRARNPILALEKFGTEEDERIGNAGSLTCIQREEGGYLIQLRRGGSIPFQQIFPNKPAARLGWKKAKALI